MILRSVDRLDPVRRLGPPRPGTLLRVSLVAVLLCLAAAALYAETGTGQAAATIAPGATSPAATPSGRLPLPPGLVGVPVRLTDAAPLAVLRPGDRVDLVELPGQAPVAGSPGSVPQVLAAGVLVLDAIAGADPPVLYLALTETQAGRVLGTPPDARFGVIVRSR